MVSRSTLYINCSVEDIAQSCFHAKVMGKAKLGKVPNVT